MCVRLKAAQQKAARTLDQQTSKIAFWCANHCWAGS